MRVYQRHQGSHNTGADGVGSYTTLVVSPQWGSCSA